MRRIIVEIRGRRNRRAAVLAILRAERARYGDDVAKYRATVRARRGRRSGKDD